MTAPENDFKNITLFDLEAPHYTTEFFCHFLQLLCTVFHLFTIGKQQQQTPYQHNYDRFLRIIMVEK